jgi:hypothetical protein
VLVLVPAAALWFFMMPETAGGNVNSLLRGFLQFPEGLLRLPSLPSSLTELHSLAASSFAVGDKLAALSSGRSSSDCMGRDLAVLGHTIAAPAVTQGV